MAGRLRGFGNRKAEPGHDPRRGRWQWIRLADLAARCIGHIDCHGTCTGLSEKYPSIIANAEKKKKTLSKYFLASLQSVHVQFLGSWDANLLQRIWTLKPS